MPQGITACSRCGNGSRRGARYCDACGTLLPRAEPWTEVLLESELKFATVLFGDITASTEMVVGRSPDEARLILAPTVTLMVDAAQRFGGTVNQVLGDGVMALFGAPISQEDHALRACCAASRMHEMVAALPVPHRLRIGLASGQMLLGGFEGGSAGAYQAFGATLHLASRLQSLARPGTTLCDDSTRILAGPSVNFVEMGSQMLRGFGVEQPVFAVEGAARGGSGFPRAARRELSPLVGRERELAELSDWAQGVLDDGPCAGAILGEAGLGKSRLVWEFMRSLCPDTWHVIRADAVSYGRDVPYHFVGSLLRACFGIEAREDPGEAAARIRDGLRKIEATECVPAVLSLLSLPLDGDAAAWERLDPMPRREALRGTMRILLHAIWRRRPTLLLLEDLQWVDEESLRLLDVPPAPDSRLLLLVTQRPGFVTGWARPIDRQLQLDPLPASSIGQMIAQAFPGVGNDELCRALVQRAAGNPFFLEELARDAIASPASGLRQAPAIPGSIHAVIAARIDRIPAQDKRLLVMAAALGSHFPRRTLRAMSDSLSEGEFDRRLARLFEAAMLRPLSQSEADVAFSHALVQEVAYAGLPAAQRRDLHRQIVRTMQRIEQERLSEQAETLAYHAALGACWEELVFAANIAGSRAASRSAYAEAARFFGQAIDACGELPQTRKVLETQIDLRFALRQAIGVTALINRSFDNSKKALRLARRLGEAERLGWATAFVARDLQMIGQPLAAIRLGIRARELASDSAELGLATRYYAGQANYSRGDYRRAVEVMGGLIADAQRGGLVACRAIPGSPIIFFQNWLTWSLARLGEEASALAAARDMRQRADATSLPLCRTLSHLSEGFVLTFAGRLAEAEETLKAGLLLCGEWDFVAWLPNISSCLGHVLARLGRFDEAFEQLGRAIEVTRQSGILVSHANELAWLAEAHLLQGSPGEAARIAESAIAVAQRHQERGNEALATLILAEALLSKGEAARGTMHGATALHLATESGMAPLVARCQARLGAIAADHRDEGSPMPSDPRGSIRKPPLISDHGPG